MCSELTIKTTARLRRRSGVFIINFGYISHKPIVRNILTSSVPKIQNPVN